MSLWLAALGWLALLGAALGALWALYRQPPAVTLSREVPVGGFVGGEVALSVRAQVRSRWLTRVVIEDPTPPTVVALVQPALQVQVLGTATAQAHTPLRLNRRGVYVWPGATLHWADPLGLFWRACPLPLPGEAAPTRIEVYPGTHGLHLPEVLRPLLSEGALTRHLGLEDPLSLRGAREYVAGDPPGRIHWRLSARQSAPAALGTGLMVRELERTAQSRLTVYLDLSGATDLFVESAVRLAASLVQEAQRLHLSANVATSAGSTPPGAGYESRRAALVALAQAQAQAGPVAIPPTPPGGNLLILTQRAAPELVAQAVRARATASRVSIVAMPEGFYLEPGEQPRRQWVTPPETVRALEAQAGTLAEFGLLVLVLRGDQSVLTLGA